MPRPKKPNQDTPFSIRISPHLIARIKIAAQAMGISDAEVIRLCVGVGLEHLKRINFDLSGAIFDTSEKLAAKPPGDTGKAVSPPHSTKPTRTKNAA